jgi:putative cell wall-binding protein
MEIGKMIIAAFAVFIAGFPVTADALVSYDVIVVRGDLPTEYIIASIYSTTEKVPIVLVNPDSLQDHIRSELIGFRERGYQLLLIIGGESAISKGIENELKDMGFVVNRLWDWNRYGTAARVAIDLWVESPAVVITNGEDYSGFLLAQHAALEKGAPILFTKNGTVTEETRNAIIRLGAKSAVLVSSSRAAVNSLESMGMAVETIETQTLGSTINKTVSLTDFYLALSLTAIAILAAFAVFHFRSERGGVFLMTDDEEKLIELLKMHGKTEQNKLAHLTGYSKPRISRMLRSLEERGLIEREKFKKTYKIKLKPKIA